MASSRPWIALAVAATALLLAARPQQPARPPHITVLVSLDGFRADYLARPEARRLRELAARGTRLERMIPSFPSKTFPNHYTLVTGLYPEHHGIIANTMYDATIGKFFTLSDTMVTRDPRWWGGEPIWNTAGRQGVKAAAMFWPGADYEIGGRRPTWYVPYNEKMPNRDRLAQVFAWLDMPADRGPRFITLYFSTTDIVGHENGPTAPQTDTAIARVDSLVGALVDGIAARHLTDVTNLVVVSDHGMTAIDRSRSVYLDDWFSLDDADVVDWSPVTAVTPKPGKFEAVYAGLRRAPHVRVYRKDSIPPEYHYRAHARITPLIVVADEGWTITNHWREANLKPVHGGTHGYDPALPSMGALFIAAGPDIVVGQVLKPVRNIHVYDLLAALLGVTPAPNDGSPDSLRAVLRDPRGKR